MLIKNVLLMWISPSAQASHERQRKNILVFINSSAGNGIFGKNKSGMDLGFRILSDTTVCTQGPNTVLTIRKTTEDVLLYCHFRQVSNCQDCMSCLEETQII